MIELNEYFLTEDELKEKVNTRKLSILDFKGKPQMSEVNPYCLVSHRRFDIMAKFIYGWLKENRISCDWGLRLYDEHIRVFNNYDEGDGSEKKGIEAFTQAFDETLKSIKENGFDERITLIPVGRNNEPLDGAHRLAAALIYNKNVKTVSFNEAEVNYNYTFFTDRGLDSLDTKYCDAMAYEYCRIKPDTYIVMLFPAAVGKRDETKVILRKYGDIVYEKDIIIGNNGPRNLIIQLYKNEMWIGNFENNYLGADEKFKSCFNGHGPLSIFLFETGNASNVLQAKQEIRALYGIGKHSAHINDTHDETIEIAQLLFNDNSIHFLNNADPYKYENFYKLLNKYKEFLRHERVNKECFCLGASSVMAAYGIREPLGLDIIYNLYNNTDLPESCIDYIKSNGDELVCSMNMKEDIIFNPENHFYFEGLKFISIEMVRKMKEKRIDSNDILDIRLINKCMKANSLSYKLRIFSSNIKKITKKMKRKVANIIYMLNSCFKRKWRKGRG